VRPEWIQQSLLGALDKVLGRHHPWVKFAVLGVYSVGQVAPRGSQVFRP